MSRPPHPDPTFRIALAATLLGVGILLVAVPKAKAWDIAPPEFVGRTESVVLDWPQWRLQDQCAPVASEAVSGRRILACTWTSAGLCFTAVDTHLAVTERASLLYYHEWPHCAGWAWNHPNAGPEYPHAQ